LRAGLRTSEQECERDEAPQLSGPARFHAPFRSDEG
jgi:hypothetical protein